MPPASLRHIGLIVRRLVRLSARAIGGIATRRYDILRQSRLRLTLLVLALVLLWPTLVITHLTVVAGSAATLSWITGSSKVQAMVRAAPFLDDVHGQLALRLLGGLEPKRLLVRDIFAAETPAPGDDATEEPHPDDPPTWTVLVYAAGGSVIAAHVAELLGNTMVVIVGILLAGFTGRWVADRNEGWRQLVGLPLAILAIGLQAYGIAMQLVQPWAPESGGGMLLSFIATKIFQLDSVTYDALLGRDAFFSSVALNAAVLLAVYLVVLPVRRRIGLRPPSLAQLIPERRLQWLVFPAWLPGVVPLMLTLWLASSALGPSFHFETEATSADEVREYPSEAAFGPLYVPPPSPSVVTVLQQGGSFTYRVNGTPKRVFCVGYNPASQEEGSEPRPARLDRDFALIRASGINTIGGWSQEAFDDDLLAAAQRNRLGVLLPFELSPHLDYQSPEVKRDLMQRIEAWVRHYKASPALRMWAVGNEVIHDMGSPRAKNAPSFATFLLDAADRIRDLDPNHPVLYRDAEDMYLEPVVAALAKRSVPRPWFVYGMNFYTYRLDEALRNGPATRLSQPLLISEFAPAGLRGADRPAGYLKQWAVIRRSYDRVLGGCAYVWSTAGPEPLDRTFGLTDARAKPVDGSLAALADAFWQDRLDPEAPHSTPAGSSSG